MKPKALLKPPFSSYASSPSLKANKLFTLTERRKEKPRGDFEQLRNLRVATWSSGTAFFLKISLVSLFYLKLKLSIQLTFALHSLPLLYSNNNERLPKWAHFRQNAPLSTSRHRSLCIAEHRLQARLVLVLPSNLNLQSFILRLQARARHLITKMMRANTMPHMNYRCLAFGRYFRKLGTLSLSHLLACCSFQPQKST